MIKTVFDEMNLYLFLASNECRQCSFKYFISFDADIWKMLIYFFINFQIN